MIVIKLGGDLLKSWLREELVDEISEITRGNAVVIVHGGGDEVSRISRLIGLEPKFVSSPEGMVSRITDLETLQVYTMVMAGLINKKLVATLLGKGVKAVGLSGVDGEIIHAVRKKKLVSYENGRRRVIEGGYTGRITEANVDLLKTLLQRGLIPVISPIAFDKDSGILNVDSDSAASKIAASLGAEQLIFITDVPGVLVEGKLVERLDVAGARQLMNVVEGGMKRKLLEAIRALEAGVHTCVIAQGLTQRPIRSALRHEDCTVISNA